jgi:hypothetical protein
MARFAPRRLGRLGARLGVLLRTVALTVVLLLPVAVVAGWLERMVGSTARTGPPIPPALENVVRHVRGLPARPDVVALAAQGTPEGHWRFVNKAGETHTVGSPEEMKRVVSVLAREAKAGARLSLYVTLDTVLRDRVALKALPPGTDLSVVAGEESYRLVRRSDAAGERYFAEVRSNLVVEMSDRRLFDEAVWQLERGLDKARLRVLALEPGGPSALSVSPRIDPSGKRALVDAIDPARLPAAMLGVAGQTLIVVGRIERDLIAVRTQRGPEHMLVAKDIFTAAAAADVNLLVLAVAPTPRQPGGRNWLWTRADVQGPEEALRQARVADVLNALGAPGRRLAVAALPQGRRTVLDLVPAGDLPGTTPARPVAELLSSAVADLTGRAAAASIQGSLRSAAHQQELDYRVVPGIPSELQVAYGLLAVLGLLGVPISRTWWQRLWPAEDPGEYAGRTGYWAARATRGLAFSLLFVPLTAPVSAPYSLGRQVQEAVTAPLRLLRRVGRSKSPPDEPAGHAPEAFSAPSLSARLDYADYAEPPPRAVAAPSVELEDDRPRFLGGR